MTNKLAIILGLLIVGALFWDHQWNESTATLFMARKFLEMIEWVAFWR
ncbi:hypothetical protein [Nereida sp. MMG025]|nr:hypothetical protein [Nereida sp. MMG025]MCF6443623.1 hypothetical protein [Nereida sp. MMG025]